MEAGWVVIRGPGAYMVWQPAPPSWPQVTLPEGSVILTRSNPIFGMNGLAAHVCKKCRLMVSSCAPAYEASN
jgi:hypothetical protein